MADADKQKPANGDQAGARKTPVRWLIFVLLLVLLTVDYIDRASISVAMPIIGRQFNLSSFEQGIILSAFFWTYTAMQIPGGWLADRFGARKMITVLSLFWGIFEMLTALAFNAVWILLMRLGLGVSEAPLEPAGTQANVSWLPRNERGRAAALMDSGAALGSGFGGLIIGALIAGLGSWQLAFAITGAGTLIMAGVAFWYIRDHPRQHPHVNEAEAAYIEAAHAREEADDPVEEVSRRRLLKGYLKSRSFWGLILAFFGFDLVFYGLLTWAPSYLSKTQGFGMEELGNAIFVIWIAGFLGEIIAGFVTDFCKNKGLNPNLIMRTTFGISAAVTAVALYLLTTISTPEAAVLLLIIAVFFSRIGGLLWSVPALITDRGHAGVLSGTMNFSGNIGGIIAPLLVGAIVQITGSFYWAFLVFVFCSVVYLVSSLVIDYSRRIPV
jgi:ACS family D-galactonate transporter-like MFS transporter